MADSSSDPLKEFPDVNVKLAAPKKLSQFEKERQAAQAKEKRAEAENAAALKAFQDSFADGDDDDFHTFSDRGRGRDRDSRGGFGGYRSEFGGRHGEPRSGPGGLPAPPPSLKRKRALDEMREMQGARRTEDMVLGGDVRHDIRDPPRRSSTREEEEEEDVHVAPRPTIQLSSLPPTSTEEDVRTLLRGLVEVHSVRFLPPPDPRHAVGRLSLSAIATLTSDVSSSQIDTAVTTLKEKYLGCGLYLSISRHLSSTAMHPSVAPQSSIKTTSSTEPFGAEKPQDRYNNPRFQSMRHAPPPHEQQRSRHQSRSQFAPPESYDSHSSRQSNFDSRRNNNNRDQQPPEAIVYPHPPSSLAQIKAIHTLIDRLLLESSPMRALQIEAYMMSLPEVQQDERFAFLYDAKSTAGVYYRYLLWSLAWEDRLDEKQRAREPERVFDDVPLEWDARDAHIPFPDLKALGEVVTDIDYISSDEDEDADDDEGNSGLAAEVLGGEKKLHCLTPLKKARLVHLLSRMPTSNAKLRKGDIARVTNFAIVNAGAGAEEIVDLLVLNVEMPFSSTLAAKYEAEDADQEQDEEDIYEPDQELSNLDSPAPHTSNGSKPPYSAEDPSNPVLISLYTISDILSASSTAGARNAWKYRALFEADFRSCKTFERLGRLEKELGMGRLKAEQWKRRIGNLLALWDAWSIFSPDVMERFKVEFYGMEKGGDESGKGEGGEGEVKEGWMRKFKRVEQSASPAPLRVLGLDGANDERTDEHVDGKPMDDEDVDGKPMDDDVDGIPMDDIDGAPMADVDDDVDGAPMLGLDDAADEKPLLPNKQETEAKAGISLAAATSAKPPPGPRRRMRAEDMFADSDEE